MISVRNLVKSLGGCRILNGLSLDVDQGEVAAVIGPSGGGKSTLLRCMNGLEPFESGEIEVNGLRLSPGTVGGDAARIRQRLRREVGMVFQQFHLFPHLTVLDNVLAGPMFALGRRREEAEPLARSLLERVGLMDKLSAMPDQLSGGQQQRVAIARALAVQPKAILCDEPTSALDPRMAAEVLAVMADLARNGQTMVVVTHAMGFARQVADTVHVMHEGRFIESGVPDAIFGQPREAVTRAFLSEAGAA